MPSARSIEDRARELHSRAIVIDCHGDLLIPIADGYSSLDFIAQVTLHVPPRDKHLVRRTGCTPPEVAAPGRIALLSARELRPAGTAARHRQSPRFPVC
jgi:hypothetical protein